MSNEHQGSICCASWLSCRFDNTYRNLKCTTALLTGVDVLNPLKPFRSDYRLVF
ncbi:MAG: hypothetical protein ACJAT7_003740, partial [Psychromonas sp.]